MGMGVYVKQMLAHFRGMFDRANLDKGARFPGPQNDLVQGTSIQLGTN